MHAIGGKTIAFDEPPLRPFRCPLAVASLGGAAPRMRRHMSPR
jgi:hypothetical protein